MSIGLPVYFLFIALDKPFWMREKFGKISFGPLITPRLLETFDDISVLFSRWHHSIPPVAFLQRARRVQDRLDLPAKHLKTPEKAMNRAQ